MKKRKILKINTIKELGLQLDLPVDFLLKKADCIESSYKKFKDKDKKGKIREYYVVDSELKFIHKKINLLLDSINFPTTMQGGIKGRSIYGNALIHSNKKYVANFDIKNFFPSVNYNVVYKTFLSQKCTPDVARLLTRLTTVDSLLPQGFSTSPKISVLVLMEINNRLNNIFKRYSLNYTFWIDDLTVSGNNRIDKFTNLIYKIFKQSGFLLNSKKTNFSEIHRKQICTGLIINCKPNADKKLRKEVRKELYLCRKFGVKNFVKEHKENISVEKYLNTLRGKINFLCSLNSKYNSYKIYFEKLI